MASPSKMDDKNPTVLIAEDDQAVRELLSRTLGLSGMTVLLAEDAQNALQIAATYAGTIDLLVTDIQMPGMNGVDLARELKRMRPDIPVLLISGYADGIAILQVGWFFLKKPFRPATIVAKVKEALGHPASAVRDPPA